MVQHRHALPQLADKIFLTDSGIETTMIFHDGFDMPSFEAFKFMETVAGREWFAGYFRRHAEIARGVGAGFIFESPTWRANITWGEKLGFKAETLARIDRESIRLMAGLRKELATPDSPMVLSGCLGPLGDGYKPNPGLTAAEAEERHGLQVRAFAETEADMVSALTLSTSAEAIGIARAAAKAGMPACISFTVETDGRLATGQTLKDAILSVDAATNEAPAYYMVNCAHPTHVARALVDRGEWIVRIRGLRANASRCSHAELDEAAKLDTGNPAELGAEYRDLRKVVPNLTVLGGCCGTDYRHVEAIAEACCGDRRAA